MKRYPESKSGWYLSLWDKDKNEFIVKDKFVSNVKDQAICNLELGYSNYIGNSRYTLSLIQTEVIILKT